MSLARTLLKKGAAGAFLFLCLGISAAFAAQTATPIQKASASAHHSKAHKASPSSRTKTKKYVSSHSTAKKPATPHHPTAKSYKKKPLHTSRHKKAPRFIFRPAALPSFAAETIPALQPYQSSVCTNAKAEIGTPYEWGGTSPDGFDCSGFSQYVYKQQGFQIPRTAAEQFASLTPVYQLQPGDLVFFRLHGRNISHVGIYIGEGEFIHSPARGQDIRIDALYSSYWRSHYAGARRVITWNSIVEHFKMANLEEKKLNDSNNQELEIGADTPATGEAIAGAVTASETVYPADAKT